MADFGIGVASSVLIEVVKGIMEIVEEVRVNKKQAKVLAKRCQTVTDEIDNVLKSNAPALSTHPPTYSAVVGFVQTFKTLLESIKLEMQKWSGEGFWTRVFSKGEMADAIKTLDQKFMDEWKTFQTFLALQNIGTTSTTIALLEQTAKEYDQARKEDAIANAMLLAEIRKTMALAQESKSLLDEQGQMIVDIRERLIQMTPGEDDEDDAAKAHHLALLEALRNYNGDMPSLGIDSSELTISFKTPFYTGQHSQIFRGFRGGSLVAIKRLNLSDPEEVEKVYERITNESTVWKLLKNDHIIRFLGCCRPRDEIAYMVSEWAANGDARRYLRKNPSSARLPILAGVARGLHFLHTFVKPRQTVVTPIVHASLKGGHVLLDENLVPKLSDFGIAFIANEVYPGSRPPATRWSAPELLKADAASTKSDMYSLGMVIIELLTINDPMNEDRSLPHMLANKIIRGARPSFPPGGIPKHALPDADCVLWQFMQRCWAENPAERPDSEEAVDILQAELALHPSTA